MHAAYDARLNASRTCRSKRVRPPRTNAAEPRPGACAPAVQLPSTNRRPVGRVHPPAATRTHPIGLAVPGERRRPVHLALLPSPDPVAHCGEAEPAEPCHQAHLLGASGRSRVSAVAVRVAFRLTMGPRSLPITLFNIEVRSSISLELRYAIRDARRRGRSRSRRLLADRSRSHVNRGFEKLRVARRSSLHSRMHAHAHQGRAGMGVALGPTAASALHRKLGEREPGSVFPRNAFARRAIARSRLRSIARRDRDSGDACSTPEQMDDPPAVGRR